jgi:hypothetical protein
MLKFITDQRGNEPDILSAIKNERLMIVSIENQLLATYDAPKDGWTHELLELMADEFPKQWSFCGADALIGNEWVGSTEV